MTELDREPVGRGLRPLRFVVPVVAALLTLSSAGAKPEGPSDSVKLESANGASGVRFLEPDRWGLVQSVVSNRGNAAASVLVAVTAAKSESLGFSSLVWLPPMSRRVVRTPFLPPASDDRKPTIDVKTRLVFTSPGGDRSSPAQSGSIAARAAGSRYETGILGEATDELPGALIGALRKAAGVGPANVQLSGDDAPAIPETYEGLDCLFIANPGAIVDSRRKDAIRRWVARGGRVWLMLDRTPPAWAAEVFGQDWDVAALDTVEVTRFEIEGPSGPTKQDLDYGVPLVRVLAPSFEVTHRVNGYPAAMRKALGSGELLVSLLGPRGWLTVGGMGGNDFVATPALQDLQSFVAPAGKRGFAGLTPPEDSLPLADHLRRAIGYSVLDRKWITVAIGGAAVQILAAGAVLARRSRLEFVAVIGVVGSLAAAAVLAGVGSARQSQTPSTVAIGQLLTFNGRDRHADCTQRACIYTSPRDAGRFVEIDLTGGGMIYPQAVARSSSLAVGSSRLVWSDPEHVALVGPDARAGSVRELVTRSDVAALSTPKARVVLGADGLTCELDNGGLLIDRDPILVTRAGCIALRSTGDGRFAASESDLLPPGVLGRGVLLSADEASRQRAVEQLLQFPGVPLEPSLFTWASPLSTGLRINGSLPTGGTALAMIPISVAAPTGGGGVWVPASLMRMAPMRGTLGGRALSAAYDTQSGRWLSNVHQPMLVVMRFSLPEAVRSLDIESASLLVDINAPGRGYEIVVSDGDRLRVVATGSGMPGPARFEMIGDRTPVVGADGVLLVGIDVKAGSAESDGQGWSIRRMELSVTGRMK